MSISSQMQAARNKIHGDLMKTDPTYREGVLSIHLQSYWQGEIDKDVVKELLGSYGYTFEEDTAVHPSWGWGTITL